MFPATPVTLKKSPALPFVTYPTELAVNPCADTKFSVFVPAAASAFRFVCAQL